MDPRYSISNITVKRYCGENTSGGVLWENSTMPKFFFILITLNSFYFRKFPTYSYLGYILEKKLKNERGEF